jgi:hypothetical protein
MICFGQDCDTAMVSAGPEYRAHGRSDEDSLALIERGSYSNRRNGTRGQY